MDEGNNMCLIFPGLIKGMHEGELKDLGEQKQNFKSGPPHGVLVC